MLAVTFLAAVIAYTAIEIAYWYFHWWATLKNEPLPIVKSMLSAVGLFMTSLAIAIGTHLYTGQVLFNDPLWLAFVGAGMVTHLLPVWKQKLGGWATPGAYALKAAIVGGLATWLGYVL